jgi:hypothetical protein
MEQSVKKKLAFLERQKTRLSPGKRLWKAKLSLGTAALYDVFEQQRFSARGLVEGSVNHNRALHAYIRRQELQDLKSQTLGETCCEGWNHL